MSDQAAYRSRSAGASAARHAAQYGGLVSATEARERARTARGLGETHGENYWTGYASVAAEADAVEAVVTTNPAVPTTRLSREHSSALRTALAKYRAALKNEGDLDLAHVELAQAVERTLKEGR